MMPESIRIKPPDSLKGSVRIHHPQHAKILPPTVPPPQQELPVECVISNVKAAVVEPSAPIDNIAKQTEPKKGSKETIGSKEVIGSKETTSSNETNGSKETIGSKEAVDNKETSKQTSKQTVGSKEFSKASSSTKVLEKIKSRGTLFPELEDEPYYHGYMTREEAERLLTKQAEFIVRRTEVRSTESIVISVKWNNAFVHIQIQKTKTQQLYWVNTYCFRSIPELVRHHQQTHYPVHRSGVQLDDSVDREHWELYHEQITLGKKLGHGEFGEVFSGTLTLGVFKRPVEVAIKTLKSTHLTSDDRITFLREACVMLKLHHRNVVRLYGVATQKVPIMIVMEIAPGGSLLERVRKKESSLSEKRKYCKQVINGMAYLESQQVIHRDLAARNCLLGAGNECKISDFGLSLLGKMHKETGQIKVPVRWLAPETLQHGTFSSKTDVWSCGVTMYEVFTNGKIPYEHVETLRIVRRKVSKEGMRLAPPKDMPTPDALTMLMCFETPIEQRPLFIELKKKYHDLTSEKLLDTIRSALRLGSSSAPSDASTIQSVTVSGVSGSLATEAN